MDWLMRFGMHTTGDYEQVLKWLVAIPKRKFTLGQRASKLRNRCVNFGSKTYELLGKLCIFGIFLGID